MNLKLLEDLNPLEDIDLKLRDLVLSLKKKIKDHSVKTVGQLIELIESDILKNGFKVAFPTNILMDQILSNYTYNRINWSTKLSKKIYTVDFGVLDPHTGTLIDTAVTVTEDLKLKSLLNDYRTRIKSVENNLSQLIRTKKGFWSKELSLLVNKSFKGAKEYKIIHYCAAHQILKNKLHGAPILMAGDLTEVNNFWLGQGDRFTIEPHVVLCSRPIELDWGEGSIIKGLTSEFYDSLDLRLGNLTEGQPTEIYYALKSNNLSFYEEDTYLIKNGELVNLTRSEYFNR